MTTSSKPFAGILDSRLRKTFRRLYAACDQLQKDDYLARYHKENINTLILAIQARNLTTLKKQITTQSKQNSGNTRRQPRHLRVFSGSDKSTNKTIVNLNSNHGAVLKAIKNIKKTINSPDYGAWVERENAEQWTMCAYVIGGLMHVYGLFCLFPILVPLRQLDNDMYHHKAGYIPVITAVAILLLLYEVFDLCKRCKVGKDRAITKQMGLVDQIETDIGEITNSSNTSIAQQDTTTYSSA
jgi:hypothetical protein